MNANKYGGTDARSDESGLVEREGSADQAPPPSPRRNSQVMNVSPEFMALAHAQFEALATMMDADR